MVRFSSTYEELFYKALTIRLVEERIIEIYPSDKIQSPVHLSIGQEAVAVGVCQSLRPADLLFTSYRSHAFYLAKGGNLKEMFAELFGKAAGGGGGKAGSMHLLAPEVGFMVASAVVASTIPHAVGAALAARYRGLDQISVATFGDGATEEGVFHESLNFASLHNLALIFVCENNGFAVHSNLRARQSYAIIDHPRSYGIPVAQCAEGFDFAKVHELFSRIVEEVRRSRSPYFVEIRTHRHKEHVGPGEDYDAGYRSRESLESWNSKDPLVLDRELAERYRPSINAMIDDAVEFAERSPWPSDDQVLTDVI